MDDWASTDTRRSKAWIREDTMPPDEGRLGGEGRVPNAFSPDREGSLDDLATGAGVAKLTSTEELPPRSRVTLSSFWSAGVTTDRDSGSLALSRE